MFDKDNRRQHIFLEKAHQTHDLRGLLIPFLNYRAVFKMKPSKRYETKVDHIVTCYGDEHNCSYKQCLAGFFKTIELDRIRGYEKLIDLIEKKYKGQYRTAKIYGRDTATGNFDHLHRVYLHGKLETESVADPEIDPRHQVKTIYFHIEKNRLVLSDFSHELTVKDYNNL